jgi:hypothetical protein
MFGFFCCALANNETVKNRINVANLVLQFIIIQILVVLTLFDFQLTRFIFILTKIVFRSQIVELANVSQA